jgi:hypothetical protein
MHNTFACPERVGALPFNPYLQNAMKNVPAMFLGHFITDKMNTVDALRHRVTGWHGIRPGRQPARGFFQPIDRTFEAAMQRIETLGSVLETFRTVDPPSPSAPATLIARAKAS